MSAEPKYINVKDAPRIQYVPALDGLRGLSLPGTILTHYAIFLQFRAGAPHWLRDTGPLTMNIQMFFVLSGALITSLMVSEHQRSGTVSLKKFYLRRSRRLGPALVTLLPLMVLANLLWGGSAHNAPLGDHPWLAFFAVAAFCGNWVEFRISAGIGWLGPAWTLGIEEQFYLTWPVLLRLMLQRGVRRWGVLTVLALALVASLVGSFLLYAHNSPSRMFYATPTQLPAILIGCALGYELTANRTGLLARVCRSPLVGLIGLGGMILVAIELHHHTRYLYRGGYVPYAVFACLLIGHCFVRGGSESFVGRFFGWKPFVVVGQISYEAYLIHTIVIIAVADLWPGLHVYPMMALDTLLVAVISAAFYYSVEQPIRRRGWRSFLHLDKAAAPASS
jgi:peptidoglycan/LPS O-acetylase OafA/YrhL